VSALLGKRLRIFLSKLKDNKFKTVFSEITFEELILVLQRPKYSPYLTSKDIQEFLELLGNHSILVTPTTPIHVCRDEKDNSFLECALAANADYIVSGDNDLLVLNPFKNIPIIKPADFIKMLERN